MRFLLFMVLLTTVTVLKAQSIKPKSIYVSYFGEAVTHPGLKVGIKYQLKSWENNKTRSNQDKKIIQKSLNLIPSVGFFYHKDYQTGIFLFPEISYSRKNVKGNFLMAGLGAGYMWTFIPNVYDLNSNGEIENIKTGYNYFLTNYSITFGKDLSIKKMIPISLYIKPQLMYALPNTANGISYFALELGISYKLKEKNRR